MLDSIDSLIQHLKGDRPYDKQGTFKLWEALKYLDQRTNKNGNDITNITKIITPSGPPSSGFGNFQTESPISGTINGVNLAFTFAHTPIAVILNGLVIRPGTDYTQSTVNISMIIVPMTGDYLLGLCAI